jgi:hypothetical protein
MGTRYKVYTTDGVEEFDHFHSVGVGSENGVLEVSRNWSTVALYNPQYWLKMEVTEDGQQPF